MKESTTERDTKRLEAFSDAVFAIAITLLILEIKVPVLPEGGGSWELGFALIKVWPSFMAFAFSFLSVLVIWANHHCFFELVEQFSRRFIYANGFLLLMVTFVPFPTAVLAKYIATPAARTATILYCATYLLVNIAYLLLWWTAVYRRKLLKPKVTQATVIRIRNAYWLGVPIYLCAMILAFGFPWVALTMCCAVWIFWAFLDYR